MYLQEIVLSLACGQLLHIMVIYKLAMMHVVLLFILLTGPCVHVEDEDNETDIHSPCNKCAGRMEKRIDALFGEENIEANPTMYASLPMHELPVDFADKFMDDNKDKPITQIGCKQS